MDGIPWHLVIEVLHSSRSNETMRGIAESRFAWSLVALTPSDSSPNESSSSSTVPVQLSTRDLLRFVLVRIN